MAKYAQSILYLLIYYLMPGPPMAQPRAPVGTKSRRMVRPDGDPILHPCYCLASACNEHACGAVSGKARDALQTMAPGLDFMAAFALRATLVEPVSIFEAVCQCRNAFPPNTGSPSHACLDRPGEHDSQSLHRTEVETSPRTSNDVSSQGLFQSTDGLSFQLLNSEMAAVLACTPSSSSRAMKAPKGNEGNR